jgi:putative acetyltransferase
VNTISVAIETPLQDDVQAMIAELNAIMQPLTPRQFQFQMTAEQINETATTLFVARDKAGSAVGMGALKFHGADLSEVKRMYTRPVVRGGGVGHVILDLIEAAAHERRLPCLKLETGEAPGFEPAWRLYERAGFTICSAFLDYPDSGYSRFYEKKLS